MRQGQVTLIESILRMKLILITPLPLSSSRISTLIGCLPSGMELIFILARPQPMASTLPLLGPFIAVSYLLLSPGIQGL